MLSADQRSDEAFTLVEVLLAMVLLATTAVVVASLFAVALRDVRDSSQETAAILLAIQKTEQLRGAESGAPVLATSPSNSLDVDVDGYAEEIDASGRLSNDSAARGTIFLRRWSVQPQSGLREPTVVIRVRVTLARRALAAAVARRSSEARITTVRATR